MNSEEENSEKNRARSIEQHLNYIRARQWGGKAHTSYAVKCVTCSRRRQVCECCRRCYECGCHPACSGGKPLIEIL